MNPRVDPETVVQRPYYANAVARAGIPLFLTGQVAWDRNGAVVGAGDIEKQAAQVWSNISAVVSAAGATLEDIVKVTTYATNRAHIPALHAERAKHFEPGALPASTFLQVSGLAEPDLLVEIEAILMLSENHPAFRHQSAEVPSC